MALTSKKTSITTVALAYERTGNPYFEEQDAKTSLSKSQCELVGPAEVAALDAILLAQGYDTRHVDGAADFLERFREFASGATIVFNRCRGFAGPERKALIPIVCHQASIPIVGSSGYTMTLARNKFHTNRLLGSLGFRVPACELFAPDTDYKTQSSGKRIVKANYESGAIGIHERSVASSTASIADAVARVHATLRQAAVVEEYIPGAELKVAVIGTGRGARALGCVSALKNNAPMTYTFQTREDLLEGRIRFSPATDADADDAMRSAVAIHRAIGCRDYSRIDFRLDTDHQAVCIEVTTTPDLSPESSFVTAAAQSRGSHEATILSILEAALERVSE
jgi:D-alanine-D-alanine ligase